MYSEFYVETLHREMLRQAEHARLVKQVIGVKRFTLPRLQIKLPRLPRLVQLQPKPETNLPVCCGA